MQRMVLGHIRTHIETGIRERRRLHVSGMCEMSDLRAVPALVRVRSWPNERVHICLVLQSLLPHLLTCETWWLRMECVDSRHAVAVAVARMLLRWHLRAGHLSWRSSRSGLRGLPRFLCLGRLCGLH